jgi:hypothetical protein
VKTCIATWVGCDASVTCEASALGGWMGGWMGGTLRATEPDAEDPLLVSDILDGRFLTLAASAMAETGRACLCGRGKCGKCGKRRNAVSLSARARRA